MTHKGKATELFKNGYNCSQAVLGAYAEECGLTKDEALRLASSFGGGMGRLREVCGAVSAMFMIAGLKCGYSDASDKDAKDAHYKLIQQLASEFNECYGTYICRDLLKIVGKPSPVSTPRTPEFYKVRPCIKFILTACEILDRHFF